jgi:hypothetical protein
VVIEKDNKGCERWLCGGVSELCVDDEWQLFECATAASFKRQGSQTKKMRWRIGGEKGCSLPAGELLAILSSRDCEHPGLKESFDCSHEEAVDEFWRRRLYLVLEIDAIEKGRINQAGMIGCGQEDDIWQISALVELCEERVDSLQRDETGVRDGM